MSDGFEMRVENCALIPLSLEGRGRGPSEAWEGEGDVREAPSLTPSSFRRSAPPSFSPEGRRS
jgi:hypothetical protein